MTKLGGILPGRLILMVPVGEAEVFEVGNTVDIGSRAYVIEYRRAMSSGDFEVIAERVGADRASVIPIERPDVLSDDAFGDACAMAVFVELLHQSGTDEFIVNDGSRARNMGRFTRLAQVSRDAAEAQAAERKRRRG